MSSDGEVVIRKRVSRAKVLEFFASLPIVPRFALRPARPLIIGAGSFTRSRHTVKADASKLCEGLPQAQQERRQ